MTNTRKKTQAANTAAQARREVEEQPSANKPSPVQQEELRRAEPAVSEQRMTTMEDEMNDLKEMIKKQAEDIDRMARERAEWQKQQQEF
jgi:hypothetical protein